MYCSDTVSYVGSQFGWSKHLDAVEPTDDPLGKLVCRPYTWGGEDVVACALL